MGCSVSNLGKGNLSVTVIDSIKIRDQFLLPIAISRSQEITSEEIHCLKFSIKEEYNEEHEERLSFLRGHQVSCLSDLNYILNCYQHLKIHLSYFESKAHGACIPNYDFDKGLKIFILCLNINQEDECLYQTIKKFPYLRIQKSHKENFKGIVSAWENLTSFIEEYSGNSIKDSVHNIQVYIKKASSNSVQSSIGRDQMIISTLGLFIRLGSETIATIDKCKKSISTFTKALPKFMKNIEKKREELPKLAGVTVVTLVHNSLVSQFL